jgi:DNA repair exonuclease SbcCD nuclease subunit
MGSNSATGSRGDSVTLLAIGDVHLGTRPASVPGDLTESGVEPGELTPEAALGVAVEQAIAEGVDAVLFAGDVVESANARFEAIRPLEAAVRRLAEVDIPVLGVAGNHDVEALPRLARRIDGFTLLGEGGRWQSHRLERDGRAALEVVGWSFPEREVRNRPLADLLREPLPPAAPNLPRIGILHGDLDASGGHYAPVSRGELESVGLDAWLLGHVHRPSLGSATKPGEEVPCGYLGSLVGLDPTETGSHGPWLIRVLGPGQVVAEHLPIAPLRWEQLDVAVEEAERPEDLGDRLLDETERLAHEIHAEGCVPRALGVRIRLTGPTRHYGAIQGQIEAGRWHDIRRVVGDTAVFVDKVSDGLQLAVDLESTARGGDPPALLARKLLALRRGGEERSKLLELARSELRALAEDPRWMPLGGLRDAEDPLSDDALCRLLEQSSTTALHALLSQREAVGGEPS